MTVKPIPDGFHTATPYLICKDAARAMDFYKQAFDATEVVRLADPSGKIAHAEFRIGNSPLMLADEFPESGFVSPQSVGGSTVTIMLYVEDADATFKQALTAGATTLRAIEDNFFGDRSGTLTDPFGHLWTIATHKEDVSPEEMKRRFESYFDK